MQVRLSIAKRVPAGTEQTSKLVEPPFMLIDIAQRNGCATGVAAFGTDRTGVTPTMPSSVGGLSAVGVSSDDRAELT